MAKAVKLRDKPVIRDNKVSKSFSYSKDIPSMGVTSLSFTLRVDRKDELKAFRELMVEGIKDIDEVLETFVVKK